MATAQGIAQTLTRYFERKGSTWTAHADMLRNTGTGSDYWMLYVRYSDESASHYLSKDEATAYLQRMVRSGKVFAPEVEPEPPPIVMSKPAKPALRLVLDNSRHH